MELAVQQRGPECARRAALHAASSSGEGSGTSLVKVTLGWLAAQILHPSPDTLNVVPSITLCMASKAATLLHLGSWTLQLQTLKASSLNRKP